jgi:hypothetical protein
MKQSITPLFKTFLFGIAMTLLSILIYTKLVMPEIPKHETDTSIDYEVIRALHDAKADRQAYLSYDVK